MKNFVSKDLFDKRFLDIYFCPFLKNQNTFHFPKPILFSSCVATKNLPFSQKHPKSPSLCSTPVFKYLNK